MIIKAGTYRFNDTLQPQSFETNIAIHFEVLGVFSGTGENVSFDPTAYKACEYISVAIGEDDVFGVSYLYKVSDALNFGLIPAYSSTYGWNTLYQFALESGIDSPQAKGYGQIIHISIDTEVDGTFATWFTDNTKRCIPKGTYTFKDTPIIPEGTSLAITFTNASGDVAKFSIEGNDNMTGMTVIGATQEGKSGALIQYFTGLDVYGNAYIYHNPAVEGQTNGWIYPCQTVTFTEDVYTNNENVAWFSANTGPVIKAGTYRFNKTLTAIPATIQLPYEFYFGDGWERYNGIYLDGNVLQWFAGTIGGGSFVNNVYNYKTQTWEYDSERVIIVDTPQTVSKDFYTWFNENTPSAATPIKKFTRLYIGDVAYSSGGKCFKRLTKGE